MGKVVKSIRIDEEMLKIIERYKKEMKRMFGISVSTGNILSTAVVIGFEENLKIIKLMMSQNFTVIDEPAPIITDETRNLLEDYDSLRTEYLFGEEGE